MGERESRRSGQGSEVRGSDRTEELVSLLGGMARALVDSPGEVQVYTVAGETALILEVQAAESDVGQLIGKEGRTAGAIRTILSAAATKRGLRVMLEILE